jgi:hypothetical protein
VPVIKLHKARHSANSLMRDARVDQELQMRIVGHASADINDRYTHTLAEAHRAAAEQTAAYVLGTTRYERGPDGCSTLVLLDATSVTPVPPNAVFRSISAGQIRWGGWGSNPRPADYEKYGFVHHAR